MATVWMAAGAAGYAAPVKLTVVMLNNSEASRTVIVSAAREARSSFLAAGLDTEWILCSHQCPIPAGALRVTILSRPSKSAPVSSLSVAYSVLCSSGNGCAESYVFYDRIVALAATAGPLVDVALGCVMAHEIGHQMGLAHSPGGIMKAHFNSHDLLEAATGMLGFSQDDGRNLRAAAAVSKSSVAALPVVGGQGGENRPEIDRNE